MTKSIKRMKRLFAWGTALLLVGGMQAALLPVGEPITPVDYVSTLVGTQSKHALSTGNLSCCGNALGYEFLDTTDRYYGGWMGLYL